ncbi:ferric reductase like transmembrane component-domain-containing protein [Halteromyces radiatus]|uniref:ferric reductase like transmembrane component-domain-containing protein n=1 Tax=Halteromyces radiatus TaxID=101107 RepID=UPI00221ED5D7|nr:ferric reductase like transmembrane component-domain-containing protein [Halteromyces radiatus]KAI8097511.1 ferric reductase like transmembrane component-domain-containing protein [Halteromyces radiatus]
MNILFSFTFLILFLQCTLARIQVPPLTSACETVSENYLLSNCTKSVYFTPECQCNSPSWLGSLALCISDNDENDLGEQQRYWSYVQSFCVTLPDSLANTVSMQSILTNATNNVIPVPANASTDIIYAPIRFPKEDVLAVVKTVNEFNKQLQYGIDYGAATCAFVFGVLVLGMLNNLFHHSFTWRYTSTKQKPLPPSSSWMKSIRRHIINPSLFFNGVHLQNASWFGILVSYPTRLESIMIFFFVVLNVILIFPNYDLFLENTYWPDDLSAQLGRYISDRSGEMAFAQLPMVYLFGGRNNILIWLTGWSYDRFIVAHKWASRMMMFHAIVHSAGYTWCGVHVSFETYKSYFQDLYFVWGVVATVLGGFILLLALPNLRRSCYDLFLYIHIILVLLFTVGCWYHVKLLDDQENLMWLYASIAIWAFDRVARFVRVAYYNIMLATGHRLLRKVKADILPGTDCIRFRVESNKVGLSRRVPGVFVYIYVPQVYFWQSHPFTIASWHQPSLDKQSIIPSDAGFYGTTAITSPTNMDNKKTVLSSTSNSSISTSSNTSSSSSSDHTFDLLIRPQQGMTKKLYETVQQLGPGGGDMYVLIEGPYGHTHPVLQYDTAILVGGGVGCTATVPYLQEAVYNMNKIATRHLVFVWVVQQDDQLCWAQNDIQDCLSHVNAKKKQQTAIGEEDSASKESSFVLDVSIYVTRSTRVEIDGDGKIKKNEQQEGLTMTFGTRPDLDKLLGQYIEMDQGSVALLHCGPDRMSDQIRHISAHHGIAYFEEAFNW